MSGTHARLSPSTAHRWIPCPGSMRLIDLVEEARTGYGATPKLESATDPTFEGTTAHWIASECLTAKLPAATFVGHKATAEDGTTLEVTEDMCVDVQSYIDYVEHRLAAMMREWEEGGRQGMKPEMHIEVEVPIGELTGEEGATGTSDVILIGCGRMEVIDLKFGRGVQVFAEDNWQMIMYALGALQDYLLVMDVDEVAAIIHQPRLRHIDEHRYQLAELEPLRADIMAGAAAANQPNAPREPGAEQCKFCPVKAICPEHRQFVLESAWPSDVAQIASPDDFDVVTMTAPSPGSTITTQTDAEWLAVCMSRVDMIEGWCRAVRAEVERRLVSGEPLPGWKLVQGKRGNRQWSAAETAEETLRSMRLKVEEMYDLKLISPTTAEKLQKAGKIGPRQWKKLQELITQSEGKPSVAPESDARPALSMSAATDDFDDVSTTKE